MSSRDTTFGARFLAEAGQIAAGLDMQAIEKAAQMIAETRSAGGRLFILGVGGSAANASHAVNDFRKIAGIEAYAPTDNVSELTARTNDEGWATVFEQWLKTSRLAARDLVLVFSVGGGDVERNVSPNLVAAVKFAKTAGAKVVGVVGRDGGYTAKVADACVLIPTVNPEHVTPHVEAFHSVVWHLWVSHPAVKVNATKWESTAAARAVFLDRDGVLNRAVLRNGKPHPPASVAELEVMPNAQGALGRLREKGYKLLVVTNQPDVSRGVSSKESVEAIHKKLAAELDLDEILVCYHSDADHCECRKPKPGLLLDAARRYQINLAESFMVGDRWRDVEAGQNAGCRTILIDAGYQERKPGLPPTVRVHSLQEAADWILEENGMGVTR